MYGNRLYDGRRRIGQGLDKLTGKKLWETKVGTLAAASPALAVAQGLLFVPCSLTRSRRAREVRRAQMKTGRSSGPTRCPPEASPRRWPGGLVTSGTRPGRIRPADPRRPLDWTTWPRRSQGRPRAGPRPPALLRRLHRSGLRPQRSTGHRIWAVNTTGANFGFGSGNFYVTPSLAFGRVYMGNTDGRVYSFVQRTASWPGPRRPAPTFTHRPPWPTSRSGPDGVLGSYDGNFYAFNARSGAIRWTHRAGGRISGSAMLVNGIVYYQDLGIENHGRALGA